MTAQLRDIAVFLPRAVLTNDDLRREHPEWNLDQVVARSGVKARHVAAAGETALDLGLRACQRLFEAHPGLAERVDTVIFCTQSPDYILPPNACVLHKLLGLPERVAALDINHACSGYVYSLLLADSMIRAGTAKDVLLVHADTYTKFIHPGDRSARVLFGDGAAASWISAGREEGRIEDVVCGTAGAHFDKFFIPAGGCRTPRSDDTATETTDFSGNVRTRETIHMSGRDILSFVSSTIPRHVTEVLKRNGLGVEDVDLFIFHQASALVLDSLARLLRLTPPKVYRNLERIGNTVSASIPIAVREALDAGRVARGERVLLCGFGAGLSWGSALVTL